MRFRATALSLTTAAVVAATVLVPTSARAQEIKAGFSASTISFQPENSSPELSQIERRNGFVGGVSLLFPTNKVGGYQFEALFHQKGARNLLRRDDRLSLTYFEIPMLLHIDVAQRGPRAVFLIAGAAPAINMTAWYEDEGVEEDVSRDIETFDIGLVIGGGVELRNVTLEARYTWGLRSTFHDSELEGSFKNRTFTVMAGLRLGR